MSPDLPENNFHQYNETGEWKKFLIQLRSKALPHINKHFYKAEDQEDVLADLLLTFISKLLKNRDVKSLTDIWPTPSEQHQFLAHIKDRVIDIYRRINGRQRPPSNIKQKSKIEQKVYRKLFMQKSTADQIINELCSDGKIEAKKVLGIIEHLESELGERARRRSHSSFRSNELLVRLEDDSVDLNFSKSAPDQSVIDNEQGALLKNALAQVVLKLFNPIRILLGFRTYFQGRSVYRHGTALLFNGIECSI